MVRNNTLPSIGQVIVINGASSAGKSSMLAALQDASPAPFLDAGLDKFLFMLPKQYLNLHWMDVLGRATEAGPMGHTLIQGMHRAVAVLAKSGLNVVVDHVMVEPSWAADCATALEGVPAYLVGAHCPLEELERRETKRKDRTLGQARAQFELVHQHGIYDLDVDTSQTVEVDGDAGTVVLQAEQ